MVTKITVTGETSINPQVLNAKLAALAELTSAEVITYEDKGNMEIYLITKNGKTTMLKACGGKFDGGFLAIEPWKQKETHFTVG
jgi:hypothetical protein